MKTLYLIPCLLLANAGLQAVAQSVTQSVPFNFSNSGPLPLTVVTLGEFTGTFQPFNPALGTLESFQINWSIDFAASGTVTGDPSGSFNASASGGYRLNGLSNGGYSNSDGDGGPTDQPVSLAFSVADPDLFLVSNAGVTYNPSLLAVVLGANSFPIDWDTAYVISGSGVGGVSGSAIGSVELIYNYSLVPEADTYAAAGLLVAAVGGVAWRRRSQGQAVQS